jgi:hypothetical protein
MCQNIAYRAFASAEQSCWRGFAPDFWKFLFDWCCLSLYVILVPFMMEGGELAIWRQPLHFP